MRKACRIHEMIKEIPRKIKNKIREKLYRADYYEDLGTAVDYFEEHFNNNHRLFSLKLIKWNLKAFFKIYSSDSLQKENNNNKEAYEENAESIFHDPDPGKLNIGFLLNGGLGDYVIAANYIYCFYRKYKMPLMVVDIFFERNPEAVDALIDFPFVDQKVQMSNRKVYRSGINRKYDLFLDVNRFSKVGNKRIKRLNELHPDLFEFILNNERFEFKNPRMSRSPQMDGQLGILSMLEGKNRIQQPDVNGILNIERKFKFPLSIRCDEISYLSDVGLEKEKFVLINNDTDQRYGSTANNKTWLPEYFGMLISSIKEKYTNWKIVGIGLSNSVDEYLFDKSLFGETDYAQLKVLLKNAHLLISAEGGLVHLREALHGGTSVVLFGPTDPLLYGYEGNINLRGKGCAYPCEGFITRQWATRCSNECKKACMWSLKPQMVMEAIEAFEKEKQKNKDTD